MHSSYVTLLSTRKSLVLPILLVYIATLARFAAATSIIANEKAMCVT